MKGIQLNLDKYKQKSADSQPRHEKAFIAQEIIKVVGDHKIYNFGFWLRKIGNRSYGEVLEILKYLESLPPSFNKGAILTNRLCGKTKRARIETN